MTRSDWRLLDNGSRIPAETYADQPYVVRPATVRGCAA